MVLLVVIRPLVGCAALLVSSGIAGDIPLKPNLPLRWRSILLLMMSVRRWLLVEVLHVSLALHVLNIPSLRGRWRSSPSISMRNHLMSLVAWRILMMIGVVVTLSIVMGLVVSSAKLIPFFWTKSAFVIAIIIWRRLRWCPGTLPSLGWQLLSYPWVWVPDLSRRSWTWCWFWFFCLFSNAWARFWFKNMNMMLFLSNRREEIKKIIIEHALHAFDQEALADI